MADAYTNVWYTALQVPKSFRGRKECSWRDYEYYLPVSLLKGTTTNHCTIPCAKQCSTVATVSLATMRNACHAVGCCTRKHRSMCSVLFTSELPIISIYAYNGNLKRVLLLQ
jgi:tRNA U38,U39,U40 pseudouridine synthase TruA